MDNKWFFNQFFKRLSVLLIFFSHLLISPHIFSQEDISFQKITTSLGLSHNSVTCFGQDNKGFIWIGTIKGLNRYDGYSPISYTNISGDPKSISGNYIQVIYNDREGNLWIGTRDNGLNKYIPAKDIFQRYLHDPADNSSISSNNITSIVDTNSNFLWIGTNGGGLNKFDKSTGKFSKILKNRDISDSISKILYQQDKNILWVGSIDDGLGRLNIKDNTFKTYKNKKSEDFSLSDNHVTAILLDKNEDLWVGTYNGGLNKYSKKADRFFQLESLKEKEKPHSSKRISDIIEDNTGTIWVGTSENGLAKYDRKKNIFDRIKQNKSEPDSLSSNRILTLFQSKTGLLWIGTDRGGICIYDKLKSEFLTINNYTNSEFNKRNGFIEALLEDIEGNLWVGYDNGIEKINFNPEDTKSYKSELISGLKDEFFINILFEDQNGDVWIGTKFSGLFRYIKKTGQVINFKNNPDNIKTLSDNFVTAIIRDRNGTLWIATREGVLNKYNDTQGEFQRYTFKTENNIKVKYISSMIEDSKKNLWIGTNSNGLIQYNKNSGSYKFYENIPGNSISISSNSIYDIHIDSNEDIWVATSKGGLNKFVKDKQIFKRYTDNGYFKEDSIYSIIEDHKKFLWFITNKRVIRFDPVKIKYYYFDKSYWMKENEIMSNSGILSKKGRIIFGGTAGITFFNPDSLTIQDNIPDVLITSILINEKPVNFNKKDPETGIKTLKLHYSNNSISFFFDLIDFRLPNKSRFKYIFEGQDPDWTISEPMEYVQYEDISPGEYIFRVKGANHYGVWNNNEDAVKIIIVPPFWMTIWFKLLMGLLLIGIIYSGIKRRIIRHQKQQEKLERSVLSRTEELQKKQDELEIARDLIEERNIELQESQEYYRAVAETSIAGICVTDLKENIQFVNPAFGKTVGYTQNELVGMNLSELSNENEYKKFKKQTGNRKKNITNTYEAILKCKNGLSKHVLVSAAPLKDEDFTIIGALSVIIDNSEQKKTEELLKASHKKMEINVQERTLALSEAVKELNAEIIERNRTEEALYDSEEKFRSIYEDSKEMIFISTPDGEFIDLNPAGIEMLGYDSKMDKKKIVIQNLYENPLDREILKDELEKNNYVKDYEYELRKKNGEVITIQETATVVRDKDLNIVQYRGIIRDVTESRNKETELRTAKETAEQANIAKNEFLSNISHEIRTPLNAILGFSELILEEKSLPKTKKHATLILTESEHLIELINEILDASKIESGKFELVEAPFDLEQVIESVNSSMCMRAKTKHIDYSCKIEKNTTTRLIGDPKRLRQILVNLIGNSIKFTSKGFINISCRQIQNSGKTVELYFSIKDTGIGIPKNKQSSIFESFVQADGSSTRKYGGSGLGTTISKQIIELMNGEIGFESEEGKGSTFWFTVKLKKGNDLSQEEVAEEEALTDSVSSTASYTPLKKNKENVNILLVEDYPANQQIATTHLTNAGYRVKLAENGRQAIQLTKKEKFDLILMDIQMPVMDGYQATKLIRSGKSKNADIPIIALTGNVYKKDQEKYRLIGMNDVIAKPFHKTQLLKIVENCLNPFAKQSEKEPSINSQKNIESKKKKTNEPLDYKKVIEEFDGDKDLVDDLITEFLEDMKNRIVEVNKAINNGDLETIRTVAHKIKGGAGNLTADRLANTAKNLEKLSKSGNIPKIKNALEKMDKESKKLRNFYNKLSIE